MQNGIAPGLSPGSYRTSRFDSWQRRNLFKMNRKIKLVLFFLFILICILIFLTKPFNTGKIIDSGDSKPSPRVIPPVRCEKVYVNNNVKIELRTAIKNFGEDGTVTVVGEIDSTNDEFDASQEKVIYLEKGETEEVLFSFDAKNIPDAKCLARVFAS